MIALILAAAVSASPTNSVTIDSSASASVFDCTKIAGGCQSLFSTGAPSAIEIHGPTAYSIEAVITITSDGKLKARGCDGMERVIGGAEVVSADDFVIFGESPPMRLYFNPDISSHSRDMVRTVIMHAEWHNYDVPKGWCLP